MDTKTIATILIIGILIGTGMGYGLSITNTARLQTQIDSLKIETDKIPNLEQQITALKNEKLSLQSQLDSMNSTNAELKGQIESLQTQITAKDSELASLKNEVHQLQDELIVAYTRVEWADTLNLEELAELGLNYVNGSRNYLIDLPIDQYFFVGLLSNPPKMWMSSDFHESFTEVAIQLSTMTDSDRGREIETLYKRCYYNETSKVISQIPLGIQTFEPI
jgi:septal ring factor EnvC (AmiA/AmiB activator)